MKTIIKSILTICVIVGFVCIFGESEDMTSQILWTLSWMVELTISSWALVKLSPETFKD